MHFLFAKMYTTTKQFARVFATYSPVAVISALLGWVYYAYAIHLFEYWRQTAGGVIQWILFHILFLLLLTSYCRTVVSDPGSPANEFRLRLPESQTLNHTPLANTGADDLNLR